MTIKQRVRRTILFWRAQGTVALVRLVLRKARAVVSGRPLLNPLTDAMTPAHHAAWVAESLSSNSAVSAPQIADRRFPSLRPIKTFLTPSSERRRVNVVTDSISKGSLFGGVGTALILAAQLANRMDASLRIITRTERAPPENVQHIFSVYGITLRREIQFVFADVEDRLQEIELQPDDLFITTSWWTTVATLPAVPHANIVYLLQEDERMFYPFGDDRLKCEQMLAHTGIRFVINTRLLFDHLVATGLENVARNAVWFEPAFPPSLFHPRSKANLSKRRFFFYARPNNLRNLFQLGIQVIEQAVKLRVLDPAEWEIYLVGKDIPPVVFADDVVPRRCEDLNWSAYAELAGTIDLALTLMYTPHPSYPPLDMAASGAVVVTNRFGSKQDLSTYSPNILCAAPQVDDLVDALRRGVALAQSPDREAGFARNGMRTNWQDSFEYTLKAIAGN